MLLPALKLGMKLTNRMKRTEIGGFFTLALPCYPFFRFVVVQFLPFTIFTFHDASVDVDQMRGKG